MLWGDTHHPAISETDGEYDGQFLFINDKANARLAVIDLRDFATKQIVKNPNAINDHGGAFVTPNTEYVIEGPQYAAPIGCEYAPIEQYKEKYRGLITFWAFDRAKGRVDERQIVPDRAAALLAGPVRRRQERQRRLGVLQLVQHRDGDRRRRGGNPPFEAGATKNDMDYLHIIDWKKAEAVVQGRQGREDQRHRVIRCRPPSTRASCTSRRSRRARTART